MTSNLNLSFPQSRLIRRVTRESLPKKLFETINSLIETADTSTPFNEVRFANSNTGRDSDIIDLERLISTPNSLQRERYLSATSFSNNTKSSPSTTYSRYHSANLTFPKACAIN